MLDEVELSAQVLIVAVLETLEPNRQDHGVSCGLDKIQRSICKVSQLQAQSVSRIVRNNLQVFKVSSPM